MIEAVTLAETRLQKNRKAVFVSAQMPQQVPPHDVIAPLVRGACSVKDGSRDGAWRRLILDFRSSDAILNFVNGKDVARYSQEGVVTPDITIRIKNTPLLLPPPGCGQDRRIRAGHAGRRIGLHGQLQVLFRPSERPRRRHQNDARSAAARRAGAGARTVRARAQQEGRGDRRRSRARPSIECITDAEAIGRFRSISEDDMFDVEYWSLGAGQARPGQTAAARGPGRGRSPARAARSGPRPPRRLPPPAPKSRCWISILAAAQKAAAADRQDGIGGAMRRHQ